MGIFFFFGWIKIKMGKVDMSRNRIKKDVDRNGAF